MSFYSRKNKYMDLLEEAEQISVSELAEKLFISEPTVRRDLSLLKKDDLVIRTHGGVMLNRKVSNTKIPMFLREKEHNSAKSIIGKKASLMVRDGLTIMMDASTTVFNILPYLDSFNNLFVITSGVKTSYMLAKMNISNVCSGGRMISSSFSYVGIDAERTIQNYNADIVFLSCRGLSLDGKITDSSIEENNIRQAMMKNSKKTVLLCDSSKIDKIYLHNLCMADSIDEVICETPLPPKLKKLIYNS